MNQAALIQALCDDLTPVTPASPSETIVRGALIGGSAALLAVLAIWGVQPGIDHGWTLCAFLLKAGAMMRTDARRVIQIA